MSKYYAFASTEDNYKAAVEAKEYSGPLETMFSTDSIPINRLDEQYDDILFSHFPEHRAFSKNTTYFYLCNEIGQEIK